MENIYYVYAYIRSKDSATAKAGTPYYIGKGSKRRAWDKHKTVYRPKNKDKIIIIKKDLDWYEANDLEIRLIRWYGRKDTKTGILFNRTDGGDGAKGHTLTLEAREKMSKSGKGRIPWNKGKKGLQVAWNKDLPGIRRGVKNTPLTIEKMKEAAQIRVKRDGPPKHGFKKDNDYWKVREKNRKSRKISK